MRHVNCTYWKICDEAGDSDCSAETLDEKQVVKVLPTYAVRQPLNVIVDLIFTSHQSETEAFFFQLGPAEKGFPTIGLYQNEDLASAIPNYQRNLGYF